MSVLKTLHALLKYLKMRPLLLSASKSWSLLFLQESIRDCFRLGRYSENSTKPRPILISLTKTSEVELNLSKRFSISASDRFRIKPDLSPEERATESLLLKERRNLIASGIDKRFIRIRRNRICINRSQHGEVTNGVLQLTEPSSFVNFKSTTID